MNNNVDHPAHYTQGRIECIDFLEDQGLPFHLANAVKYIVRCRFKGALVQDLHKAIWYLERFIALIERGERLPAEEPTVTTQEGLR